MFDGMNHHEFEAPAVTHPTAPEVLHGLSRLRRLRATLRPEKLFAQPVLDMLLELLEFQLRGQRISVSSLYISAGVPAATALRRIREMEAQGLIRRVGDPSDKRRNFIELSAATSSHLQCVVADL